MEPFTDPDFPPGDCSLYANPSAPKRRLDCQWLRPTEIRDTCGKAMVFSNPRPEDIMQGVLKDCWSVCSTLGNVTSRDTSGKANKQWTVFNNPKPEDIMQGVLEDCWSVCSTLGHVTNMLLYCHGMCYYVITISSHVIRYNIACSCLSLLQVFECLGSGC